MFIDEVQYLDDTDLAATLVTAHLIAQRALNRPGFPGDPEGESGRDDRLDLVPTVPHFVARRREVAELAVQPLVVVHCTHSSVAYSTSSCPRHGSRWWITFALYSPIKDSAIALS